MKSFHTLDTFASDSTEAVPDGLSDEIDFAETTRNIAITILIIRDQLRKIADNVETKESYECRRIWRVIHVKYRQMSDKPAGH